MEGVEVRFWFRVEDPSDFGSFLIPGRTPVCRFAEESFEDVSGLSSPSSLLVSKSRWESSSTLRPLENPKLPKEPGVKGVDDNPTRPSLVCSPTAVRRWMGYRLRRDTPTVTEGLLKGLSNSGGGSTQG